MNRIIFTFLLLVFSAGAEAQSFTERADSLMQSGNIPELGYAVVKSDKIIESQILGYHRSDLKNDQTKARMSDYFHLGSNTKAITGFIAAHLVEQNKISWKTRLFDLFPDLKQQSNAAYFDVSLADLLSHRARIQPFTSGAEHQALPTFKGTISEKRMQFAVWLLKQKPVADGEAAYNYSNAGYSIAVMMLEKVTKKTWEELVEEVLDKKLKLSYKFGWPNKNDDDQPWGHWEEKNKLVALPGNIEYSLALIEPAGDISMPLLDYAKFIQLNLRGLGGANNFLKASTYNYLHFGIKDYAIGWGNVNNDSLQRSQHAGSAGTFYVFTLIDKKHKTAYIIVANTGTEKAQRSIIALTKLLIKKYSSG